MYKNMYPSKCYPYNQFYESSVDGYIDRAFENSDGSITAIYAVNVRPNMFYGDPFETNEYDADALEKTYASEAETPKMVLDFLYRNI